MPIRLHQEDPALLRESITYTSAEMGFIPRLIEKDYFCSVVLEYLAARDVGLVFKGGTCLSKIHGSFYRLSEDLDFSISTAANSTRGDRRRSAAPIKAALDQFPESLLGFTVIKALTGANNSKQYVASVGYESLIDGHLEPVSIEIGLRETHMMDTLTGSAHTALINPITGQPLIGTYAVPCLPYAEAMAEKLRAALCRRDVAIRDFFDVDYASRTAKWDVDDPVILDLLRRKCAVPGNDPVNTDERRMQELEAQVEGQLRPVLRADDFAQFSLERAIATVSAVAQVMG